MGTVVSEVLLPRHHVCSVTQLSLSCFMEMHKRMG